MAKVKAKAKAAKPKSKAKAKAKRPAPGQQRKGAAGIRKVPARPRPAPGQLRTRAGAVRPAEVSRAKPRPRAGTLDGLEQVRDILAKQLKRGVTLKMKTPERGKGRTPWAVIAQFKFDGASYARVQAALRKIEDSRDVEKRLGGRSYARMSIDYRGVRRRDRMGRTKREWTIGEIAPWEVVASRAVEAVRIARQTYGDQGDQPGGESEAVGLSIWISSDEARDFLDEGDEE